MSLIYKSDYYLMSVNKIHLRSRRVGKPLSKKGLGLVFRPPPHLKVCKLLIRLKSCYWFSVGGVCVVGHLHLHSSLVCLLRPDTKSLGMVCLYVLSPFLINNDFYENLNLWTRAQFISLIFFSNPIQNRKYELLKNYSEMLGYSWR